MSGAPHGMAGRVLDPAQPITLTLTAGQWNVVFEALRELPYRVAVSLLNSLSEQIAAMTPPEKTNSGRPDGETGPRVGVPDMVEGCE